MKITRIALLLLLTVCTFSCSSDDDPTSESTVSIVGTWNGTDLDYTGTSETSFLGETITSNSVGEATNIDFTLTFTENPNMVVADGSYDIEVTTTALGQTTTQTLEDVTFLNNGTWELEGDQLTVIVDGETENATVVTLNDTSLVLNSTTEETVTQQGVTTTTTANAELVFERL